MRPSPYLNIIANITEAGSYIYEHWNYNDDFSIASLVISGICMVICIYLMGHIIYYRESRVYASASWLTVLCIPIAAFFGLAGVPTWLGAPTDTTCVLRWWFDSALLSLMLGPLLARCFKFYTWKRNGLTVLTKEYADRFTLSFRELAIYWMLPILLGELVILVFYTAVVPSVPTFLPRDYLQDGTLEASCQSATSQGAFYAWIGYNLALCVANLAFVYVLKSIPLSNDVLAGSAAALNTIILASLTGFISSIVNQMLVTVALVVWAKILISMVAVLLIVLPKWWAIQVLGVVEPIDVFEASQRNESSQPSGVKRSKDPVPQFYSESSSSSVASPASDPDDSAKLSVQHPASAAKSPVSPPNGNGIADGNSPGGVRRHVGKYKPRRPASQSSDSSDESPSSDDPSKSSDLIKDESHTKSSDASEEQ